MPHGCAIIALLPGGPLNLTNDYVQINPLEAVWSDNSRSHGFAFARGCVFRGCEVL